jgi:hypothetical protein
MELRRRCGFDRLAAENDCPERERDQCRWNQETNAQRGFYLAQYMVGSWKYPTPPSLVSSFECPKSETTTFVYLVEKATLGLGLLPV